MNQTAPVSPYWFKKKKYGYGWFPGNWKGWAALVAYLVIVTASATVLVNVARSGPKEDAMNIFILFVPISTALSAGFIYLCYKKGEPLSK